MINKQTNKLFSILVKEIKNYESDTFSASAERLSYKEAKHIANTITQRALQDYIDTTTLDGIYLSEELENIR